MTRARVLAGAATTLGAAVVFWLIFLTQLDRLPVAAMGAVMMAAMMLPSAVPLVAGQAQRPLAVLLVLGIYLSIWSAIGVPALLLANTLPAAPIALSIVAVLAATAYGSTPLQRACGERCRALCGSQLPALQLGLDYSVACIGCSTGVMAALFIAGPMNPLWMLVGSAVAVAYKLPRTMEIGSTPRSIESPSSVRPKLLVVLGKVALDHRQVEAREDRGRRLSLQEEVEAAAHQLGHVRLTLPATPPGEVATGDAHRVAGLTAREAHLHLACPAIGGSPGLDRQ